MDLVCWRLASVLIWDTHWPMAFLVCSGFGVIWDMVLDLRISFFSPFFIFVEFSEFSIFLLGRF